MTFHHICIVDSYSQYEMVVLNLLINEITWKFDLRIQCMLSAFFIGNDLCDQLSVDDGLSWIVRPSPELTFTSAYGKVAVSTKADSCTLSSGTNLSLFSFRLSDLD